MNPLNKKHFTIDTHNSEPKEETKKQFFGDFTERLNGPLFIDIFCALMLQCEFRIGHVKYQLRVKENEQ